MNIFIMDSKTTVIIAAGGSSSRMGQDKIFTQLCGKPVLLYSLKAFQKAESIDEIIVVANPEKHEQVRELCKNNNLTKVNSVIAGGGDRSESVRNGLEAITNQKGIVAIHDGARPLVTVELINEVIKAAKIYKAAIPVVAVRDTIKEADGGFITSTPDRSKLYQAQTPQAFDLELYRKACNSCLSATDDSSLIEQLDIKVKIVDGDYKNIKITTPEDLITAKGFLHEIN